VSAPTSVPLSGFLNLPAVSWQSQVSRPCFVPPPFLGFSLQSLPLTGIACPSRGRFAPLQLSTRVLERRLLVLVTAGFLDSRARTQSPDSPADYGLPFHTPEGTLPVRPGPERRNRSVPPASPASKPRSSCESVRAGLGCPKSAADPLLGFCLSRAFSFHASDPRPAQTRGSEHVPSPEGSGTRLEGPLDPSRRVRRPSTWYWDDLVDSFRPLGDRPAPPLDGAPTPLALELRASPSPLTFEALKYVESGVSPRRSPSLLRFLASSASS
jgi:hypothetical protein